MQSKYTIPDKFTKIIDPETGHLINAERTILRTIRPTDIEIGVVKQKQAKDGSWHLDYSDLVDLTPDKKDLPAGVEVILMNCNEDFEKVPVMFNYESLGEYRGVWIKTEDLERVSGNQGIKLKFGEIVKG